MNESTPKIILTGTFDLDPLKGILDAWWQRFDWKHEKIVEPATKDPAELVEQALRDADPQSLSFLIVRPSDWNVPQEEPTDCKLAPTPMQESAQTFIKRLIDRCAQTEGRVVVLLTPLENSTPRDCTMAAHHVENQLFAALSNHERIHILPSPTWMGANGGDQTRLPLLPALAMMVARHVYQAFEPQPQLLVVHDEKCLWQEGAKDAPDDRSLTVSASHQEIQRALAERKEAGVLLAIASDKSEEIARERFRELPGMALKETDIAAWCGEGKPIREKVEGLAARLGTALHHVAFMSRDSALVDTLRAERPEILSIALPETEEPLGKFLQHLWSLDCKFFNSSPANDGALPAADDSKADRAKLETESHERFVETLGIAVNSVSPTPEHHARMAQLTQETAALNATARKFKEDEIKAWLGRPYHYAILFKVRDSHADHGVAGLIMFERVKRTLLVHNFLVSDLASGSSAETLMLSKLGSIAQEHKCTHIDLPFLSGPDNELTAKFLSQTVADYQQDLPEAGWHVYQIPAEAAQALATAPAVSQAPRNDEVEVEVERDAARPLSAIIQEIATNWPSLSLEGYVVEKPRTDLTESPFSVVEKPAPEGLTAEPDPAQDRTGPSPLGPMDQPEVVLAARPAQPSPEAEPSRERILPVDPPQEAGDESAQRQAAEDSGEQAPSPRLHQAAEKASTAGRAGKPARSETEPVLFVLSADSPDSLVTQRVQLAEALANRSQDALGEIASTLATTRHGLAFRSSHLVSQIDEARKELLASSTHTEVKRQPSLIFLFPDSWAAHDKLGTRLYDSLDVFRETVDWCSEIHQKLTGHDLRKILHSASVCESPHLDAAMFAMELAMAKQWIAWGLYPDACFGQGSGEYVAACLAEVFSPEEGLALVAKRAELITELCPKGRVLQVFTSAKTLLPHLDPELQLAASQSPDETLLAGTREGIATVKKVLDAEGLDYHTLPIGNPRHTSLMEPMAADYRQVLEHVELRPPLIPFLSATSGNWITPETACDPNYWAGHLSRPLQTAAAMKILGEALPGVALEVGPGKSLSEPLNTVAADQIEALPGIPDGESHELPSVLATLGRLWEHGSQVDWSAFYGVDSPALFLPGTESAAPPAELAQPSPCDPAPPNLAEASTGSMCAAQQLLTQQGETHSAPAQTEHPASETPVAIDPAELPPQPEDPAELSPLDSAEVDSREEVSCLPGQADKADTLASASSVELADSPIEPQERSLSNPPTAAEPPAPLHPETGESAESPPNFQTEAAAETLTEMPLESQPETGAADATLAEIPLETPTEGEAHTSAELLAATPVESQSEALPLTLSETPTETPTDPEGQAATLAETQAAETHSEHEAQTSAEPLPVTPAALGAGPRAETQEGAPGESQPEPAVLAEAETPAEAESVPPARADADLQPEADPTTPAALADRGTDSPALLAEAVSPAQLDHSGEGGALTLPSPPTDAPDMAWLQARFDTLERALAELRGAILSRAREAEEAPPAATPSPRPSERRAHLHSILEVTRQD